MYKAIFLLVCSLVSLAVARQTQAQAIELPLRLVNGMSAVEVFVNGQGPFVFRIDTGGAGGASGCCCREETQPAPSR